MENTTAVCGLNMAAADPRKLAPMLAMLCFEKGLRSLAVIGKTTKTFEQILPRRIGRYAGNGSYIEMTYDDGLPFRWIFANGQAHKVRPVLAWPESVNWQEGEYSHG